VYKDYKPEPGKYNREFPTASTHPHFALLEIMSETGLTGLAAIIFMLFLLFRELLNTPLAFRTRIDLFPWFLGVTIGIVPNVAKAFYSSFWMSIVLCMLFIGIANIAEGNENR
jgi:O-antigen ligase